MAEFIDPAEMKQRSLVPLLNQLEEEQIDDLFLLPAERMIAHAMCLNLDTNGEPWHWRGRFDASPATRARYREDYRLAVVHLVNRMASNPHGFPNQSLKSGSTSYGKRMPSEIYALMKKWGRTPRVFRA